VNRPRLWFVVPIHGRVALTAVCLRQLRRTCDALTAEGVAATAVVVGDESNLAAFREQTGGLGFATVRRDNAYLSRKFNDGIQLALDPAHNHAPAGFVVPFGSDDWIDHRALLDLPNPDTVVCFQHSSCVREDGREIAATRLASVGGSGVRIYPSELLEPLGYRPADEDRRTGCDTSILVQVMRANPRASIDYRYLHDRQIVDWKTQAQQLNSYATAVRLRRVTRAPNPFEQLAGVYPAAALREMLTLYPQTVEVVA
jgi:hypothetical protein